MPPFAYFFHLFLLSVADQIWKKRGIAINADVGRHAAMRSQRMRGRMRARMCARPVQTRRECNKRRISENMYNMKHTRGRKDTAVGDGVIVFLFRIA
jgi:hypothetical protein